MKLNKILPICLATTTAAALIPIVTSCNNKIEQTMDITCQSKSDLVVPASSDVTLKFKHTGDTPVVIIADTYRLDKDIEGIEYEIPFNVFKWESDIVKIGQDGTFNLNFYAEYNVPESKTQFNLRITASTPTKGFQFIFPMTIIKEA